VAATRRRRVAKRRRRRLRTSDMTHTVPGRAQRSVCRT
jgi:hypothetical protein